MNNAKGKLDKLCKKEVVSELYKETTPIIDVAIFLHNSEVTVEKASREIILYEAIKAIDQEVRVIIVAAPLVRALVDFCYKPENERNNLTKNMNTKSRFFRQFAPALKNKLTNGTLKIYTTNDYASDSLKERFAVLISTTPSEILDLKALGLSPDYLQLIQKEEIANKLSSKESKTIKDAECIKKIFYNPTDEQEKKNLPRKLIYFTGHSGNNKELEKLESREIIEASTYMGIKACDYEQLLDCFADTKCAFLLVSTCYAGGWNRLKMHSKVVPFPIVIGSITDSTASGKLDLDLKVYYKNLKDLFSEEPNFSKWYDNEKLKTSVESIVDLKTLKNSPLVCFPGDLGFKPIKHNGIIVIGPDAKNEVQVDSKKGILFTENITNTTLVINGKLPIFVSTVPGKCHHFIKSVHTKLSFVELITGMIGNMHIASPKMFFMGEVSCTNYLLAVTAEILDIKNFYFLKQYKTDNRKTATYISGGGILANTAQSPSLLTLSLSIGFSIAYASAVPLIPLVALPALKRKKSIFFTFSYDTSRKRFTTQFTDKEGYCNSLKKALADSIPKKEAIYDTHSENNNLYVKLGNDSLYYDVDADFKEKVNACLTRDGLEIYNTGSEFDFIEEENGLIKRAKRATKGALGYVASTRPIAWVVPARLMNFLSSKKSKDCCK